MRFLVDANLPPGLASWLVEKGHDAIHVQSESLLDASDRELFETAANADRAIITKDEDFAVLATVARVPTPVVWLRIGNASTAQLLAWIEPVLAKIVERLNAGETLIEVR